MARQWRAGVVGCGVAGLAAAILLARRGHRVTLLERAPVLGAVGAGLLLQPSGQWALRQMGLLRQVIAGAEPIDSLHALTHRRRTLVHLPYRRIDPRLTGYGVHRGDLFGVLYAAARDAGVTFRLGVTIESSRQGEGRVVAVDDAGSEHGPFDVLIAADGARSRLRADAGLGASVREFPLGAAWFSGRSDAVRGRLHQVTRGSRQLIGMLPVGGGRCSLFCALPAGGGEALQRGGLDALKREIVTLCPEAESLVKQIRSPADFACTKYQIVRLRRWSAGRLVCIGDAAHSTTPHLGQGVNLALLDALAVAGELNREAEGGADERGVNEGGANEGGANDGVKNGGAKKGGGDVVAALERSTRLRRRQVMWCWRLSNLLGPVFQNQGWLLAAGRDVVLPWLPRVPWVGRVMVGTMAGVQTGLFSRLPLGE